MSKFTIDEKIEIIKRSVAYVDGNRCLNCTCYVPSLEDLDYGTEEQRREDIYDLSSGAMSAMSPSEKMVYRIVSALEQVGLSAEEVDQYTDPENPNGMQIVEVGEFAEGTDFKNNRIGGCVDVDDFLKCIRKMLEEKGALAAEPSAE